MFKLFQKKADGTPEERIAQCIQKKDYAGLAKAYYELGISAMEAGDQGRAMLWLSRADTVYSARDDVYDKVGEKITDDCFLRRPGWGLCPAARRWGSWSSA